MTKPTVDLVDDLLSVVPGQRVTTTLVLRNPSALVGEYRISMPSYCDASSWVQFRQLEPNSGDAGTSVSVSFLPSTREARVEMAFQPPADKSTPAGSSNYVIAIDAQEEKNESTTVEGRLELEGQPAIESRLFTNASSGRTQGRFRVGVANTGNMPVKIRLSGDYNSEESALAWAPDEIALRPREKNEFLVELRTRRPKPTGKGQTHQATLTTRAFTATGEVPGAQAHTATFEQKAWVPTFLVPLAAIAIAAGLYFAIPRNSSEESTGLAPNPPTELKVIPETERVLLDWVKDVRAVKTEVALVDCETLGDNDPKRLVAETFDDSTGQLDITGVVVTSLCFKARSVGSEDNFSKWGADTGPLPLANDDLPRPTNLAVNGSTLTFDETGAPGYQMVANNTVVAEVFTGSPISLVGLELPPGQYEILLRAVRDDLQSNLSEPAIYEVIDETLGKQPSEPWILYNQADSGLSDVLLTQTRAMVAQLGGQYSDRSQSLDLFELADTRQDGQPYLMRTQSSEREIGGKMILGDIGGGLSEAQAIDLCQTLLGNINDQAQSNVFSGAVCIPYAADGTQLSAG